MPKQDYKKIAAKLKARGYFKGDLRKKFTPQQKSAITRSWNKHAERIGFEESIIKRSKNGGDIVERRIKSKSKREELKRAGYLVIGEKAYINKDGYDKVLIKDGKIFRYANGRREIEILFKSGDILKQLEDFSKKEIDEPDTWKAVRIGNYSPFGFSSQKGKFDNVPLAERPASAQRFDNYQSLMNYISNWQPKDSKDMDDNEKRSIRNQLISSMSLITISRTK